MTQYEVNHMENILLLDTEWPDPEEWDEEEVFEDDEIDEF